MHKDAQSLSHGSYYEFIEIKLTEKGWANDILLANKGPGFNTNPVYGGKTYKINGFKFSGVASAANSTIPEPMLDIICDEQASGNLMDFLNTGNDINEVSVRRIVVNARYIDNGEAPDSSVGARITNQKWFVSQLYNTTGHLVQLKLSNAKGLDSLNDKINRTLSSVQCNKKYRVFNINSNAFQYTPVADGGCEWGQTGEAANFSYCPSFGTPYFDATDTATADPKLDRCSLSITGCKKRFPITDNTQPFPWGGNPNGTA